MTRSSASGGAAGRKPPEGLDALDAADIDTVGSADIDTVGSADIDGVDIETVDFETVDFETAVAQTGAETDNLLPRRVRPIQRARSWRRRLVSGLAMLFALTAMGGIYSAFASASSASETAVAGDANAGRQLFSVSCITCHGANLDGVKNRGPSLLGTGGASTYFYVSTGRMPLSAQGAEAVRKTSPYTTEQINDLVAYVQSIGGGPNAPTGDLRDMKSLAEGGELFRLNCASCHNFAGRGNMLSAGKKVPSLLDSSDEQLYTAMTTGPGNMPVFSDNQITPEQKKQLIAYIQTLKAQADPGGAGLARLGPITEGLVIWVAGIGAVIVVIMWIGRKA